LYPNDQESLDLRGTRIHDPFLLEKRRSGPRFLHPGSGFLLQRQPLAHRTPVQGVRDSRRSQSVGLFGQYSDSSSYYLRYFKNWTFETVTGTPPVHATQVRNSYFGGTDEWKSELPDNIVGQLEIFKDTDRYRQLSEEFKFITEYKKKWSSSPFVPSFNTADAVVVQSGHILLVRRKGMPGKGQFALPGGFIKDTERVVEGALRELKEETRIKVDMAILRNQVVGEPKLFDHPGRSLRGRTFTHAIYVRLEDRPELPEVKGSDDAQKAFWMPLGELALHQDNFFEDHYHMIRHFIYQGV
jgi:bifunctional NMN adenylyltransferase/nudix hydrolase